MEIRKVQVTGGSSYVISLPKNWIKNLNINKNDPLGLIVQQDNTLLVTTKISGEQTEITKEFNLENINESDFLFRSLIGANIAGFDNIKIYSKNRFPPFVRTVVRKFTLMTIGQEVIEESDNVIIIKDLLDPVEMPFNNTIQRMYVIAKSMFQDSIRFIKDQDTTLAEDLISRDNDVDRLHWLIARQCNIILRNANMADKMEITMGMILNYFLISKIIERIGDHAVNIVKNFQNISDKKLDTKIVEMLDSASTLAFEIFDKSIESLFKKNIKTCNECIESVPGLSSLCEEIKTHVFSQKGIIAISLGYIVESIERTGEYGADIAESVMNHLIRGKT
ncbi:PhoU domain-containing protein [[Eubacterium] cellulosolvens]